MGVFLVLVAALYQYKEDLSELVNQSTATVSKPQPDKRVIQDSSEAPRPTGSPSEEEPYFNPPFDPNHPEERYSKTGTRLVTINELSAHGPEGPLQPIWLAILGRVYDVNRGADSYYGPNGGYKVFSGRDATRAFVTGEFKGAGLTDDVTGLTPLQLGELDGWVKFYDKDYTYVGKLIGRYYNKDGSPTKEWYKFQRGLADKDKLMEEKKKEDEKFPPCNSQWTEKDGGKVYCSDKRWVLYMYCSEIFGPLVAGYFTHCNIFMLAVNCLISLMATLIWLELLVVCVCKVTLYNCQYLPTLLLTSVLD